MRDAESPARDVDFVNALVAEIAIARVPVPVPVVVEAVPVERTFLSRPEPEVVVDVRQIGGVVAGLGSSADVNENFSPGFIGPSGYLPMVSRHL